MAELPTAGSKVTLKDIAQRLRLSHVTVSLALHNHPKIPEARRQQIQQAAREMGYLPNATAVALSQHRRKAKEQRAQPYLAWIDAEPKPAGGHLANEAATYYSAVSREAARLGYGLELFTSSAGISSADMEGALRGRNVVGILFPPKRMDLNAEQTFLAGAFPAVCLGPFAALSPVRLVTYDSMTDATTAFERIWSKGYRRIGLVTDSTPCSALCRAGFTHARSKQTRAAVLPTLELCKRRAETIVAWLQRHRPDALIFEHRSLVEKLEALAPLFPAIGVALLDVPPDEPGRFAGIRRNEAEIGRVAVLTLAAQINEGGTGNAQPFCHVLIESEWVDGPSLSMRL